MSKPGLNLRLDTKDLQQCRAIDMEYITKVLGVRYKMKNYTITKATKKLKIEL